MTIVKGKVIEVEEYVDFRIGNRSKADYCPITIKCSDGNLVKVSLNTRTMMDKTYMINPRTGNPIQVGMIKPRVGDILEVEGTVYKNYNGIHSHQMKYVRRIIRSVK